MEEPLLFLKNGNACKWGPMPGRFFYMSEILDASFLDFQNICPGVRWPDTAVLFKNKQAMWVSDGTGLKEAGKKVFDKYVVPESFRSRIKNQFDLAKKELGLVEREAEEKFLSDLPDEAIFYLWDSLHKAVLHMATAAAPAEISLYACKDYLSEKLNKYIKDSTELESAIEILTAAENLSYIQQEEIDLVKSKDVQQHQKKYFWIRNTYGSVEAATQDFFAKRKKELDSCIKKLSDERIKGSVSKKRKLSLKYKLPLQIKNTAKAVCFATYLLDERKKHILKAMHFKEIFLQEAARRHKYSADDLKNCSVSEVMDVFKHKGLSAAISQRGNCFGFVIDPYKKQISKDQAAELWNTYASR